MNGQLLVLILIALTLCGCATTEPNLTAEFDAATIINELKQSKADVRPLKTAPVKKPFQCLSSNRQISTAAIPAMDISFFEADIREALMELSMLTEIPIVADETVQGLVTATLSEKSLESILRVLLAPGHFTYRKFEDFIFVGSQFAGSPSLALLAESCQFRPRNVDASQLVTLIGSRLRDYVEIDEESNLLTVNAPRTMHQELERVLTLLDRPRQQVLLEFSVVEVSNEVFEILGINWGNLNLLEEGLEARLVEGFLEAGTQAYAFAGNGISTAPSSRFKNSIGMLAHEGFADVRAMPSIQTMDGKEAQFSSTETVYLSNLESNNRTKGLVYGVNIKVVPHIGSHNDIRLDIVEASVSDLTVNPEGEPLMISHSVKNSVSVANREVVVLGGLFQKKHRNGKAGKSAPPILDWWTSQKRKAVKETEVLIVIRPTIVG